MSDYDPLSADRGNPHDAMPPPIKQAGAIPEPTLDEIIKDYEWQVNFWGGPASHRHAAKAALLCQIKERLAAAERDRDDARRRVDKLRGTFMTMAAEWVRYATGYDNTPQAAVGDAYRSRAIEVRAALDRDAAAAPGTGGTTGDADRPE
jgi:hypothetical protein